MFTASSCQMMGGGVSHEVLTPRREIVFHAMSAEEAVQVADALNQVIRAAGPRDWAKRGEVA